MNESCGKIPRRKSVMGENKFNIIFDLLKADILAGKFAGGRPLPSAPALMRRFGVARATAVAALRELVRCGFAVSRRGKGTFPTERTVGLILPGVAYSEIFLPVMSGLSRRCQDAGYGLLFGDAYSNDPVAWRGDCRGDGARRGKADRGDPPPRLQDVLLLLFIPRYGSGSGTACAGTADQVIAEVVGTLGLE